MPVWFIRFLLGLPCRAEDRQEILDTLPEIIDEHTEFDQSISLRRNDRILSLPELRRWAAATELDDSTGPVQKLNCPAPDCPLRSAKSRTGAPHPEEGLESKRNDHDVFLYDLYRYFALTGGPGRQNSVRAFLDLVRKTKAEHSTGQITAVYVTDPFIYADVGQAGNEGGYTSLLDYLRALGLDQKSRFALHLPSWPVKSSRHEKEFEGLRGARLILQRLIKQTFPNARIEPLRNSKHFHDRFYLFRDASGSLNGVFGPSLNGLRSEHIALMGSLDDKNLLKKLENMLAV